MFLYLFYFISAEVVSCCIQIAIVFLHVYFFLSSFFLFFFFFFFSSRRRHTRLVSDWSSDVWSSDLGEGLAALRGGLQLRTCDPISTAVLGAVEEASDIDGEFVNRPADQLEGDARSEERRVGKEGRSRWSPYH